MLILNCNTKLLYVFVLFYLSANGNISLNKNKDGTFIRNTNSVSKKRSNKMGVSSSCRNVALGQNQTPKINSNNPLWRKCCDRTEHQKTINCCNKIEVRAFPKSVLQGVLVYFFKVTPYCYITFARLYIFDQTIFRRSVPLFGLLALSFCAC